MDETGVRELTAVLTRTEDGQWLLATPDDQVPSFMERGQLVHDIIPILLSLDLGLSWAEAWLDLYKRHEQTDDIKAAIKQLERLVAVEKASHA